jgi:membrane protein YqaA with SNARE-associated domain
LGLFVGSFLAATILPLSSEIVLGVLLLNGNDPVTVVGVATAGNVLGSVVNYGLGFWGNTVLLKRLSGFSQEKMDAAQRRFRKYGMFSLCFAWVPIVGDPLTVAAGLLRLRLVLFVPLVTVGKFGRYATLAFFVMS